MFKRIVANVPTSSSQRPSACEGRNAAQSSDEEVSRRARELVRKIEQRLQTAKLLEPKRVRLVFQDTPLPNAVAEFAAKTGYPIQLDGDLTKLGHRKITLDTGLTTFWEATALFCRQAGLVERAPTPLQITTEDRWGSRRIIAQELTRGYATFSKPDHSLILMEGQPPALPTVQVGALRIRALPPEKQAADPTKGDVEALLALEVRPEPGITWQGVVNTRITKAIDDRGQELKPLAALPSGVSGLNADEDDELTIYWDGVSDLPFNLAGEVYRAPVRLRLGLRPAKRLRELQGTIAAQVQTPPEPLVTVNHILHAADLTVTGLDGSSVKVAEVKRDEPGQLQLRVTVTAPSKLAAVSGIPARIILGNRRGRGAAQTLEIGSDALALFDSNGNKIAPLSSEGTVVIGKSVTQDFKLTYELSSEPVKLVYSERRAVVIEVPFTLTNVPLAP